MWHTTLLFRYNPHGVTNSLPPLIISGGSSVCASQVACRVHTSFLGKAQLSAKLSVFVRENGFGVSADFWHCPGKLLKLKEMSGI